MLVSLLIRTTDFSFAIKTPRNRARGVKNMKRNRRLKGKRVHLPTILVAMFLGILVGFGLQINIAMVHAIRGKDAASIGNSQLLRFFYNLRHAVVKNPSTVLQCDLAAVLVFCLFIFVIMHKYSRRDYISCSFAALVFGMCVWLGRIFHRGPYWTEAIANNSQRLKSLWLILSYSCIFFLLILALTTFLRLLPDRSAEWFGPPGSSSLSVRKKLAIYTGLLLLFWLPMFIAFWPGNLKGDTAFQILQFFHFPIRFQGHWITDGKEILYSNDHPFIQTMLLGSFLKLGHLLGWNELGISLYVFIQMIGFILAIALFLLSLEHFGLDRRIIYVVLLMYCIMPVFSIHVVLISGDSMMTLFFMYYMLALLWIFRTKGRILDKGSFRIGLLTISFLLCASKNQCIYVAFLTGILLLWVYRKRWKQVLIAIFLPLFIYQFLYCGLLFSLMRVNKVGGQEALSVTFQQVARTVKYHGDELTEEDKKAIDSIIVYENISRKYDPDLADPVKRTFRVDASSEDLRNYFLTWARLGLKYPGEYVQAFLDFTSSYYYPLPLVKEPKFFWKHTNIEHLNSIEWVRLTIPQSFFDEMWFDQPESLGGCRELAKSIIRLMHSMPFLDYFAYAGCVIWLILGLLLLFWLQKDYQNLQFCFPVFLFIVICFLSPKNGNFRYILPGAFMLPLMMTCLWNSFSGKKADLVSRNSDI